MIEKIEWKNDGVFVTDFLGTHKLHKNVYLQLNISEGDDFDLTSAIYESEILFCIEQASNYVMNSLRSRYQVREYLQKKDYSRDVIDRAIEVLTDNGLIDDEAFALAYWNSYSGQKGNYWIEQKLQQKGVYATLPEESFDACYDALVKKIGNNREISFDEQIKAQNFLKNRGFSYENIRKAIKKYKNEE